jgi:hypothetical protein
MWQADRLHADRGMKVLQSDVGWLAKICELNTRKIKASFVCVILYTLTQEFLSNHFDALSLLSMDERLATVSEVEGQFEVWPRG